MEFWKLLGRKGRGLVEVVSRLLPEGTEENYEQNGQGSRYSGGYSILTPSER
jgi:hypothetical protein